MRYVLFSAEAEELRTKGLKPYVGLTGCRYRRALGKITLTLRGNLEQRFREEVFKRLGMKKGNTQISKEEAIESWIKQGEAYEATR